MSSLCILLPMMQSCTYEDKPKKTQNSSATYILPKGVRPNEVEKRSVEEAKKEYEEFIKKNK